MKTILVPSLEQVSLEAKTILEGVQKRMGKVPNLYATIGYSAPALKGMMDFEAALAIAHHFSAKEKEAINLVVSQVNNCEYCLAAHTALALKRGFTQEDTIAIRKAEYIDEKLNVVLRFAKSISSNKGKADEQAEDAFFNAGYDEAALVELIGLIAVRTFTNYVFSSTNIPIDFLAAQLL